MTPTADAGIDGKRRLHLTLEFGADEADCDLDALRVGDCGMVIRAPWQFPVGAILEIVIRCRNCSKPTASRRAMVADCQGATPAGFDLTLLFLEQPLDGPPPCQAGTAPELSERGEFAV